MLYTLDHHLLDVHIQLPNGKTTRPWLTAVKDECAEYFVGWYLGVGAPGAIEIAVALLDALRPHPDRIGMGLATDLMIDNGKDYRSYAIERLCAQLNANCHYTLPYRGSSKSIEPSFKILERDFVRELDGWCANNAQNKPEEINAVLTLDQVRLRMAEFFALYHARPNAGLGGLSPNQVVAQCQAAGWSPRYVPESALRLLKMRDAGATVTKYGVRLFGLDFWAEELATMQGAKVDLLYDPNNLFDIEVWHEDKLFCIAEQQAPISKLATVREVKDLMHRKGRLNKAAKKEWDFYHGLATNAEEILRKDHARQVAEAAADGVKLAVSSGGGVVQLFPETQHKLNEQAKFYSERERETAGLRKDRDLRMEALQDMLNNKEEDE